MAGATASLAVMTWLIFGAQSAIASGKLKFPGKITTIENCPANFTMPPRHL